MRNDQRKNRVKPLAILGLCFSLISITYIIIAQPRQKRKIKEPLTKKVTPTITPVSNTITDDVPFDTVKRIIKTSIGDTLKKNDSTIIVTDSLSLDNLSKDSLAAPIEYSADDSGVLDIPNKKFMLYGHANTKYQTLDLTAGTIVIDNKEHLMEAYGDLDSNGLAINRPLMKDGDMTTESDSIRFNTLTQRGLSKRSFVKQSEIYIQGARIKKISANAYYASQLRFTTCNLDDPHFDFRANKAKLINNKWAYTGLVYPEFEGVPVPIALPFGIFPLSQGRHSGFLPPAYSTTQYYGIGLEGLGYYKVLNEYVDATLKANIYSYGGYMANLITSYRKRYRFNGGVNFTYQHTKLNFKGDPDYNVNNTYSLAWFHSVDSKARPGTSFSANVNISSSKFNQLIANNPIANYTNQLSSSIQYSKTWGQGKYNLQTSATHSQNNQQHYYNISFPNINFNATTFFPFKKEERIGEERWYEKLGISYSGALTNQFAFYDTVDYKNSRSGSFLKHLLDTAQWGATHSIPITLSLPSLGPFQVSPGISYSERWFGQKILHNYNPSQKRLDTVLARGLYAARSLSTSLSFQTGIFGTFNFKKGNLVAIRHTIRPNISLNYTPDLSKGFYYDTPVDSTGQKVTFSSITGAAGNAPGPFGGLSFGINQQIEAKVRDKSDTSGKATKKIKLIDNISINSGYNFFADSNKLSDISIYIGTTLLNKINITASTSLVPYKQNKYGQRTKEYAWSGSNPKLGNINNASLSMSTSLQSNKKNDEKKKEEEKTHENNDYYNPEEDLRQQEYIRNHPAEFTDFNIPWTLSLGFTMSLSKAPTANYSGFTTTTTASLNLNGDFSLTPKWKMGGSGYVNAQNLKLEQFTMFITREMHCWQLSINVTPIGLYPFFNISINPKSGILRDLKINRTRSFQTVL